MNTGGERYPPARHLYAGLRGSESTFGLAPWVRGTLDNTISGIGFVRFSPVDTGNTKTKISTD